MHIVYGLLALVPAAMAVPCLRAGWREWRGGEGMALSRRFGSLVDEETRAGWDRSGLIVGLAFAFLAIMLADGALINLKDPVKGEVLVFAAAAAGMCVCIALYLTILVFNRPKFLVPPRHRGEPGAFAAQRRRHEGRHAR